MRFRSVRTALPDYEPGMSVELLIDIENVGPTGPFECKVYNADTGAYLGGFGGSLEAGASNVYRFLAGTMPTTELRLRVTVEP